MTTTTHDVIDAEVIAIDGTPYRKGAPMPAHIDSLTSPELAAADTALLAITGAVRAANEALAAARTALIEMEIALSELNGRCGCGCL